MLERIHALFPVLRERAQQRAGTLSGGEAQMLAIARALMLRPRFLMLDEPSLGIMPRLVDQVMDSLRRLHETEGLTMFLVEQNVPAALDLADRGYVLQTGRVVLEGRSMEAARQRSRAEGLSRHVMPASSAEALRGSEPRHDRLRGHQIEMPAARVLEQGDVVRVKPARPSLTDQIVEIAEHVLLADGATGDRAEDVADTVEG
jgi:branched-chain amino acid transport system ATP-binding protein